MSTWDFSDTWGAHTDPEPGGGVLTLEDMDRFTAHLRERAGTGEHWVFEVSPGMRRRLRWLMLRSELLTKMYRAYPAPQRKIRKCHMRKLQERWRIRRRYIRKVEQAMMAAEEDTEGQRVL